MIKPFTLGAIGSLIVAVSIGLSYVMELFIVVPLYITTYSKVLFFLTTLLGVGILLASLGYREIKNKFGLFSGTAGFAFGILASVLFFFTAVVGIITPDYFILVYPPPLIYSINFWVRLLNLIFLGLTHVVWGIAHFKSKKFCKKPRLSLVTSGFFIASGVVLLSTFSPEIGLVLSFVSLVFASNVFLAFRTGMFVK